MQSLLSMVRTVRPNGALPGTEELEASLRAGRPWSMNRDIPDLVAWQDFVHAGELAVPALESRLAAFPAHAATHFFPLPKEVSPKLRAMVCADPLDEAIYRAVVGDFATLVDFQLGSEVQSYRLRGFGSTWSLRSHKYGDAERRGKAREFVATPEFAGIAKTDVSQYYGSIQLPVLGEVLRTDLGCPASSVGHLLDLLQEWQETWGVRGVPVGPEASGILGNAMLVPLDRALTQAGLTFVRFTDDVQVFLGRNDDWDQIQPVIAEVLGELGLSLNEDKVDVATTVVEARLMAGVDRFLDDTVAMLREDRPEGLKRTKWLFDSEVERPNPSGRRLRFAISVFANARDPHGIAAIQEQRRLRHIAPKHVGRYLAQLQEVGRGDPDWLVQEATADAPARDVAAQYHLLLALRGGRGRLTREMGDRLGAMALNGSPSLRMPLRVAAADAWAKTDGWDPGMALAAVRSVGDSQLRRALVLSVRHGSTPSRRDLDRLRACEDVRPAIAWVRKKAA